MGRPSNTDERRREITTALRRVMARTGWDGATVADVAREAGIAPGGVHYHFASKLEILLALIDDLVRDHAAVVDARVAAAGDDPWARLFASLALSSLGGVAMYVVGYAFFQTIGHFLLRLGGLEAHWPHLLELARGATGYVLLTYITIGPGPYKLVTLAAGAVEMPFPAFLAILVIGRSLRFLAVSGFGRLFGDRFHLWLEVQLTRRPYATIGKAVGLSEAAVR